MKAKRVSLPFIIFFAFYSQIIFGKEVYEVNVTRKSQDLYKITTPNIYIKTRYCYEYIYYGNAILIIENLSGYSLGKIIFNSGTSCDIEKILK